MVCGVLGVIGQTGLLACRENGANFTRGTTVREFLVACFIVVVFVFVVVAFLRYVWELFKFFRGRNRP